MKATIVRFTLVTAIALTLMGVSPFEASSHAAGQFYPAVWGRQNIHYHFSLGFPSDQALRDRIRDAHQLWDALPPALDFVREPNEVAADAFMECPSDYNTIRFPSIDGRRGTYAAVWTCPPDGSQVNRFKLRLDSDENWYKGTGNPPNHEVDVWGIAAHEFAHATGWSGHFDEASGLCPLNVERHTVCPGFDAYGTQFLRPLEEHDKHTFNDAYP